MDKILTWGRMNAKASKSRSGVVVKGRCLDINPLHVGGEGIPSLQTNPVKSLGRVVDGSLSDRKARVELSEKIDDGLKRIDKSQFTGVMKLFTEHTPSPHLLANNAIRNSSFLG